MSSAWSREVLLIDLPFSMAWRLWSLLSCPGKNQKLSSSSNINKCPQNQSCFRTHPCFSLSLILWPLNSLLGCLLFDVWWWFFKQLSSIFTSFQQQSYLITYPNIFCKRNLNIIWQYFWPQLLEIFHESHGKSGYIKHILILHFITDPLTTIFPSDFLIFFCIWLDIPCKLWLYIYINHFNVDVSLSSIYNGVF